MRALVVGIAFGSRGDKSIDGPVAWNGIQVYERLQGSKRQLFALREDRTSLGRVFDSRYPQRGCREEVKFPLGVWKQGDFVHDGVPHSLRFHWLLSEGCGRGTDMRYVYSPLRGMVDVRGNE